MLGWTALLFLLSLTEIRLAAAAGTTLFTLNGTQDICHAEEHTNITLTWSYPDQTDRPPKSLFIDLMNINPLKKIYFHNSKTEAEVYIDDSYRGRLQCNLQLAMKGHIECLLNDLRLNDSGKYQWVVDADGKSHVKKCELIVTASIHKTEDKTSNSASRNRFWLYCSFGLFTFALFILFILAFVHIHTAGKNHPTLATV